MDSVEATCHIRDEAEKLGHLGPVTYAMLQRVVGYQLTRFPGLTGTDSVEAFVHSFFEAKGSGYVNAVFAVPDDAAAKRLTHKWVERWLVDQARQLPWGALRNRLEKRLERSDLFQQSAVTHHWFLNDGEDVELSVTGAVLYEIASGSHVEVSVTSETGIVRLGRTGELESMLQRVLLAAGRLHISAITKICADRFPSVMQTGDALSSTIDIDWDHVEDIAVANDVVASARHKKNDLNLAEQLLPLLTAHERTAIRFSDDPAGLSEQLGIGRSSAYSTIKKLRARLIELAGDGERSREILSALIGLVLDESLDVPSLQNVDMENSSVI